MPDTPELFEPNPLLSKFMYPMDTPLSESCPSGSMHFKRSNSEVMKVWLCILILYCLFFSAPVVI